jgi:hypothetical protein
MIVELARKLVLTLWRLVVTGEVPEGTMGVGRLEVASTPRLRKLGTLVSRARPATQPDVTFPAAARRSFQNAYSIDVSTQTAL